MDFPIYRKYINNKSFFIIHSENNWTEYKLVGRKYEKYDFAAVQFPEKLLIKDLIQKVDGIIESSEFEISNL